MSYYCHRGGQLPLTARSGNWVKKMSYYVYFIQKGYGSIKIGVSDNPEKRLKQLQTGNHGSLFIIAKFPFETRREALSLEYDLHKMFKNDKINGEWFKKSILRKFKDRSKIFPNIFRPLSKGECLNSYHKGYKRQSQNI